jgi:hypothetical protein
MNTAATILTTLALCISLLSYSQPGSAAAGSLYFELCDLKIKTAEYNISYRGNDSLKISCFIIDHDTIKNEVPIFGGKPLRVKNYSHEKPEGKLHYRLIIASKKDSMIVDFKNIWYPYLSYKTKCLLFEKGYFLGNGESDVKASLDDKDRRMTKPKLIKIKKIK